ncbi:hypothetical protein JCM19297_3060 [Nonlabens ulvanivorans]|nr:hypothetical protein JCM19297_3060 [Nonlabens ulvanivorans]
MWYSICVFKIGFLTIRFRESVDNFFSCEYDNYVGIRLNIVACQL